MVLRVEVRVLESAIGFQKYRQWDSGRCVVSLSNAVNGQQMTQALSRHLLLDYRLPGNSKLR